MTESTPGRRTRGRAATSEGRVPATLLWPRLLPVLLTLLCLAAGPAAAHMDAGSGGDGGFVAGLRHPVTGVDHAVAMIAVGIWGAQLGAPALWVLPVAFPLVMAFGGVLAVAGVPIPGLEIGIACSAILLGLAVATEVKPALWVALSLVGLFAIYHGYAHGAALPAFGVPILFASGFVLATGVLHLLGIGLGSVVNQPGGRLLVRGTGVVVTLVGVWFLIAEIG
jgi:urease accessory protein